VSAPLSPRMDALTALAVRRAWERGDLGHLLSRRQRRMVARWRKSAARRYVLNWTRRGGKSRTLCMLAIEECLRAPGRVVTYLAPTQVMARGIVVPLMRALLESAPEGTVKFNVQQMCWTFRNGSTIALAGCDGLNADRLRGKAADVAIVDEGGFVDDLTYVVESVLRAQLITTGGRLIIASTPAASPAHPFKTYALAAKEAGNYEECTLLEAEHIPQHEKDDAIEEAGGRGSPTCEREYFCDLEITDHDRAIVPEFQEHAEFVCVPWERPDAMDRYVAADFGFHDLTVVLFAYLDFERAKLVIEHELVFQGKSALDVGDAIKRTERELWKGATPILRVADAPLQQLADLAQGSGVTFAPAAKLDSEAALNHLRRRIAKHQVVILPECRTTIAHLRYGIWNKARTAPDKEFARQPGMGHFDAIDAAKYLARHVDWSRMPDRPLPTFTDDVVRMPGAKTPGQSFADKWWGNR
jgi:hypothetical protein